MRAIDLVGGAEIVSEQDCWEMLATQTVGRVAFTTGSQVEIFPVNYCLLDGAIVFTTNPGRKVLGVEGGEIAFEIDSTEPTSRRGWSVVVHGTAEVVARPESEHADLAWTGPKDALARITPRSISGRRVVPPGSQV